MARIGRPPEPFPRRLGLYVRFSDAELGALRRALYSEFPVASRRPSLVAWLRDLAVAQATEILRVEVTRAGLRRMRGGLPDWKRWKLARLVKRAATRRRGRAPLRRRKNPSP
jgi:hypothetical protein